MCNSLFKPGQIVPQSGQYEIVGPRGGKRKEKERTCVKGEPFPPIDASLRFRLVDPTKHKWFLRTH